MAARQYNWNTTPQIYSAATDPTITSDASLGIKIGDVWFNTATGNVFDAISVAAGAAIWRHRARMLASSTVAVVAPTDTSENIVATVTVPADAMGIHGALIVSTEFTCTNNANVKTVRHRFSGIGGTVHAQPALASIPGHTDRTRIGNRGAANSQAGYAFVGFANSGITAGSADTAAATTVVVTIQKATGADVVTLEAYMVELVRPDIGPT